MRSWLLLCLLLLIVVLPVHAQDGRGMLRMAIVGDINSLNFAPTQCPSLNCLSDLLFPRLLYIDPAAETFEPAPDDSFALVADWEITDERITLHLRDDLVWSDGTPITAYDVFFSYLMYESSLTFNDTSMRDIHAAVPVDETTIRFIYDEMTCDALTALNFNVIPYDAFADDFSQPAAEVFAEGYSEEAWEAWRDVQREHYPFGTYSEHPFFYRPTISFGEFRFHSRQYEEYVRLIASDSEQAIELIGAASDDDRVDMLLRGEIDLLYQFDYSRVRDLQANSDVHVFTSPSDVWFGVSFNFADPFEPLPAVDEDGNPLAQGEHRIFSERRVRRAFQLATDVPALIDAVVQGNGTVMPASLPLGTWASDPDLAPIPYDPMAAARLLEEAGWNDVNGDSLRECITCETARPFASLSFELRIPFGFPYELANILAQQWRHVGADIYISEGDNMGQDYDVALTAGWFGYPENVDQYRYFTPAGDGNGGPNTGSYNNPEVTALLEQARTVPDCDADTRADLYRQAQHLLQEDQPYIWLFSVDTHVAAHNGIANFAPYDDAIFWNIRDWVIGA